MNKLDKNIILILSKVDNMNDRLLFNENIHINVIDFQNAMHEITTKGMLNDYKPIHYINEVSFEGYNNLKPWEVHGFYTSGVSPIGYDFLYQHKLPYITWIVLRDQISVFIGKLLGALNGK